MKYLLYSILEWRGSISIEIRSGRKLIEAIRLLSMWMENMVEYHESNNIGAFSDYCNVWYECVTSVKEVEEKLHSNNKNVMRFKRLVMWF